MGMAGLIFRSLDSYLTSDLQLDCGLECRHEISCNALQSKIFSLQIQQYSRLSPSQSVNISATNGNIVTTYLMSARVLIGGNFNQNTCDKKK